MIYVPGIGPSNAKLAVVGEAPGAQEEEQRRPFAGPSGRLVDELLEGAGMSRQEVYLTNVVKIRPPNNEIHRLKELGKSIDDFTPQLWDELNALKPNCILALGNTALKALTDYTGILKYRGSILLSKQGFPKVVPTIHPAAILHSGKDGMFSWKQLVYIQHDFKRAAAQAQFSGYNLPQRNLWVCKSSLDLYRFLNAHTDKKIVTIDVETFKTIPLCIALAFNRHEGMTIPLLNLMESENPTGIGMTDLVQIWSMLAEFLYDFPVNGQNLKFDCRILEDVRLCISNVKFDTMLAFHTIYPGLPKKLEFISSILTEEPYYKDEGREYNPKKDKLERLLLYCAKDSVVEHEVMEEEIIELQELGMEDFFYEKVMPLHGLYYKIERRGIKKDNAKQAELKVKYKCLEELRQLELDELVGYHTNVFSNAKQVPALIYGDLKIPRRQDVGEETLQALIANVVKDTRKKRILELILELRKIKKTRTTYVEAKDASESGLPRWIRPGRMYTQCLIVGTESGRTATSKVEPPVSTEKLGLAFHQLTKHGNIGADLRDMFIADEGMIFIEPDYSQGESRIVCHLANEPHVDHRTTAGWLFDKDPKDITPEERQLGKMARHAGGYGMKKYRLMQLAAGAGVQISEWKAGKLIEKFHARSSGIMNVFWEGIKQVLQENNKVLWTPFGRRRQFFEKWSDDLLKEAYSYIPQSTLTDMTKAAMLRLDARASWIEVLEESHDSFLAQIPFDRLDEAFWLVKEELERPVDFTRCSISRGELVIPCEIKIGFCWGAMKDLAA